MSNTSTNGAAGPDEPPKEDAAAPGTDAADAPPAELKTAFDRLELLLEFPVAFPLKVMGQRVDHFASTVSAIVRQHVPGFDPSTIELRSSSKGTYLSVTVVPHIESRAQLEALYRELSTHPLVKVVL